MILKEYCYEIFELFSDLWLRPIGTSSEIGQLHHWDSVLALDVGRKEGTKTWTFCSGEVRENPWTTSSLNGWNYWCVLLQCRKYENFLLVNWLVVRGPTAFWKLVFQVYVFYLAIVRSNMWRWAFMGNRCLSSVRVEKELCSPYTGAKPQPNTV